MSENRRITFLIGVVLTVLALVWGNPPSRGMVTSSFLLLLSFAFFYNTLTLTRRVSLFRKNGKNDEMEDLLNIKKAEKLIDYYFIIGFSLIVDVFSILEYEYLIDYTDNKIIAGIFSISFLVVFYLSSSVHLLGVLSPDRKLFFINSILYSICLFSIFLDCSGFIVII